MPLPKRAKSLPLVTGALSAMVLTLTAGCASSGSPHTDTKQGATTIPSIGAVAADSSLTKQLPSVIKSDGLKIVTNVPYPPYQYYAANHTDVLGVDIDLGNAVAAVLGTHIDWTYLPNFAPIVPGIQAGKWQGSISGISDNTVREKVLNFIDYDNAGVTFVVKAGNPDKIHTYTDMCGKTVGIQDGSSNVTIVNNRQSLCAAKHLPPVKIVQFPDNPSTVLAVQSGRIVATMQNKVIAPSVIPKDISGKPMLEIVNDPTAPNGYPTKLDGQLNHSGIAISKQLPTLAPLVYKAMLELSHKGILQAIYKKYGLQQYILTPPTYNTPPS